MKNECLKNRNEKERMRQMKNTEKENLHPKDGDFSLFQNINYKGDNNMKITDHADDRANKRINIKNKKSLTNKAKKALDRGKSSKDYDSMEKYYLREKENRSSDIRVYDNSCYVFDENRLVTIHPLPKWFCKKAHFKGKEQIRDIIKYLKYDDYYNEFSNFHHYKIS